MPFSMNEFALVMFSLVCYASACDCALKYACVTLVYVYANFSLQLVYRSV